MPDRPWWRGTTARDKKLERDFRTLDGRTYVRLPSGMIYEVTRKGWRKVGVLTDAEIEQRKESAA